MATKNLVSAERLGLGDEEKAPEGRKEYQAPDLFTMGTAIELIQGPMYSATYRDVTNSGYTYWGSL